MYLLYIILIMSIVNLPLNNSINFTNRYLGYINIYYLDKITYIFGSEFPLDNVDGNGIKGQLINGNTIQFSPLTIIDPNNFWFDYIGGQYVPQKWAKCSLYQEINSDLLHNFKFQGNLNTNTLHTDYGDNYSYKVFILAFDLTYNLLASSYSQTDFIGDFSISLDTSSYPDTAYVQWGFEMDGYPVYITETNNQGSVNINDTVAYDTVACFMKGIKILTKNGYVPIQNLRKGDLVKTLKNGYVPINMIGMREIINPICEERIKDKLYVCTKNQYPELFEDLVITGCHAILVDEFKEGERNATIDVLGLICVTDSKYRLPACVDKRAKPYEKEGKFTIYHIALENDNYFMNYGIYANGLLVETCSQRYLKELSNMTLI